MPAEMTKPRSGPCAKILLATFGSLFLIALLAVPVTTRTSSLRQDPSSNVIIKTTFPRRATMFLPSYLAARRRGNGERPVVLRSRQWTGTMAVVAILGVFDYLVICRLLLRRRRPGAEQGPEALDG